MTAGTPASDGTGDGTRDGTRDPDAPGPDLSHSHPSSTKA